MRRQLISLVPCLLLPFAFSFAAAAQTALFEPDRRAVNILAGAGAVIGALDEANCTFGDEDHVPERIAALRGKAYALARAVRDTSLSEADLDRFFSEAASSEANLQRVAPRDCRTLLIDLQAAEATTMP